MSQYIHFFVRSTDRLLPIRTASRSSSIYQFFCEFAPYEKVRAISMGMLHEIRKTISEQIDTWTQQIEEERKDLQLIAFFTNSVEDKIEAMKSAREALRGREEIVEEMKAALVFTHFLMDMYEEAEDSNYCDKEGVRIDPTKYLYFGIECDTPSIAEIEEWENSKN